MVDELKYCEFTSSGLVKDECSLDDVVRVVANHRPLFGVEKRDIDAAFAALGAGDWAALKEELGLNGELPECLRALVGADDLPDGPLSSTDFATQVLGFEDPSFALGGAY